METNIDTRTVVINSGTYDRILDIANQTQVENHSYKTNDDKVAYMLDTIANTYYKNHKIDNLLF